MPGTYYKGRNPGLPLEERDGRKDKFDSSSTLVCMYDDSSGGETNMVIRLGGRRYRSSKTQPMRVILHEGNGCLIQYVRIIKEETTRDKCVGCKNDSNDKGRK